MCFENANDPKTVQKNDSTTVELTRQSRPLRVAAKRAREVLAIMSEFGPYEWMDEEEIEEGWTTPVYTSENAPIIAFIDTLLASLLGG